MENEDRKVPETNKTDKEEIINIVIGIIGFICLFAGAICIN